MSLPANVQSARVRVLMDAVVELLRQSIQPGTSRVGAFRVQVVEKNVVGDRGRFFEGTGAGTELPLPGSDIFFEWEGERGFEDADVTVF